MLSGWSLGFQSTHPREGVRRQSALTRRPYFNISIHAPPRRSATVYADKVTVSVTTFQSTHPREGVRHWSDHFDQLHLSISIHAPPRRSATDLEILSRCVKAISIHAPPRRSATPPRLSQNSIEVLFQSTHPREGVRPYDIQLYMMYSFISIHAPPRRSATFLWMSSTVFKSHFNPRTPAKECDRNI